jgi:hypothetical protein
MRPAAILLLCAVPLAAACGPSAPPSPAPGAPPPTFAPAPVLSVEPVQFDFGRVLPNRRLQKQFTLRNLGREALTITSVVTDCGCLVADDYARALAPGASTTLTLILTTPEEAGPLLRNVVVHAASPRAESVGLTLRAVVVAEGAGP